MAQVNICIIVVVMAMTLPFFFESNPVRHLRHLLATTDQHYWK